MSVHPRHPKRTRSVVPALRHPVRREGEARPESKDLPSAPAAVLSSHRRRSAWQRVVSVLAVVVVFCTTYALILPAITMTKPTYCGIEEHEHTEDCYRNDGTLTCELEEHKHTDECYVDPDAETATGAATATAEADPADSSYETVSTGTTTEVALGAEDSDAAAKLTATIATSDATSNIGALLGKGEGGAYEGSADAFSAQSENDGRIVTDRSVVYGADDYDSGLSYDAGDFSVTLSALGQEATTSSSAQSAEAAAAATAAQTGTTATAATTTTAYDLLLAAGDGAETGAVTFTDTLGAGMEVKEAPRLLIYGQSLEPMSTSEAGDGTTTYTWAGKTVDRTVNSATAAASDTKTSAGQNTVSLDGVAATVSTNADGKQVVTWTIPADVLPTLYPDLSGSFYWEEEPIRLVYRVGLSAEARAGIAAGESASFSVSEGTTVTFMPLETAGGYYSQKAEGAVMLASVEADAGTEDDGSGTEDGEEAETVDENGLVTQTFAASGTMTLAATSIERKVTLTKQWEDTETSHDPFSVSIYQAECWKPVSYTDADGTKYTDLADAPLDLAGVALDGYENLSGRLRKNTAESYRYNVPIKGSTTTWEVENLPAAPTEGELTMDKTVTGTDGNEYTVRYEKVYTYFFHEEASGYQTLYYVDSAEQEQVYIEIGGGEIKDYQGGDYEDAAELPLDADSMTFVNVPDGSYVLKKKWSGTTTAPTDEVTFHVYRRVHDFSEYSDYAAS